jgi:hypothetical protein
MFGQLHLKEGRIDIKTGNAIAQNSSPRKPIEKFSQ